MPGKVRKLIPRSSPAKSTPPKSNHKATAAPYSPTLHHNAPIPLRGTRKPASSIRPRLGVVGDALPSNSPAPEGQIPKGTAPQVQRTTGGSRIPAPLNFQGNSGFGLGLGLPTSTSGPKTTPVQTSPARTGRPSFHVPVIHSPQSTFVSTISGRHPNPGPGIRGDGRKPEGPPVNAPTADAGDAPQTVVSGTPPIPMCTPTASPSDVSSASLYTIQSAAESAGGHFNPELKDINASDENKEHPSDSEVDGMECGDEGVVLSPGFDVIQALADTNQKPDESTASAQSPTTPRPCPIACGRADLRDPVPGVAYDSSSSASCHTATAYSRSLVGEAVGTLSSNLPPRFPPDSHKAPPLQRSKSKTTPAYTPPGIFPDIQESHVSGNISDLIQEVETLIGHPCVDRDAVHVAHRDAGAHSETGSCAVSGARLDMTTSYKSCTSMLDGLTYTLPLMVFACVEELYCAGLRSSRLLRPPSHAPTKPTHTVSHCPDHSRSATHSYPALLAAFNTPPTYGNDIDLAFASLDDVGALLLTYLDCLPGGIIPVWMRRVLGDAVSIYEENGDGGSASMRERKRAIRVAQLVLRLLPTTQFNLLAYLLGFLSQVPLYEVWNGWNVRGVARAFARIVVGVGAGARAGDVSGTRRIDCLKNGKGDWKHTAEDVDWVAEEEDAVDVLQWLLVNWDEISGCLSLDAQPPEGQGRHVNYQYGERDGTEERETHGAAVMKRLDPPHTVRSEDVSATKFDPAASHPSLNDLLARIADLERENSKWKWLQGLHESELRLMFQAGERGTGEVEKALLEERSAREMVEDALMKERAALMNTQTSIENAVRAERRFWVEEVQALGNAWAGVGKTMAEVGSIIGVIVERGREENAQ